MIALDTNVIVRIVTGDDGAQQRTALEVLATACSPENPAWINRIVAVETVWVLERAYRYERTAIADAMDRLLHTAEVQFEDHDHVRYAVGEFRQGNDFSDALLGATNRASGYDATITFDRRAAERLAEFRLIES